MPGRVSDERLIAAFRAGDEAAFQQIHDRYRAALLRFATRILRDGGTAEDVVQEALWRAHRGLRRDDRPMNLRPWLYRLVRNCGLDELGRVRTDCVDLYAIDGDGDLTAAPRDEPPTAYERRADLRQLLEDLGALPARHRHALVRRELDGLTHQQLGLRAEHHAERRPGRRLPGACRADEDHRRALDLLPSGADEPPRGPRRAPPRLGADPSPSRPLP